MADNRLVAVCLYGGCDSGMKPDRARRKTIARFTYSAGWDLVPEGTAEFFRDHNHGLKNCIVFVPEDCERENFDDEQGTAEIVSETIHGKTEF